MGIYAGETAGERERRLRQSGFGATLYPFPGASPDGAGAPSDPPAGGDVMRPPGNATASPLEPGNAANEDGPSSGDDNYWPDGFTNGRDYRRAIQAERRATGDALYREMARTGFSLDNPDQLAQMLDNIGVPRMNPDKPIPSHQWQYWTGQLPSEGFGMQNIGPYKVPAATQLNMPDWFFNRTRAVQGGHWIKGAVAGTYYNPRGDGTADMMDQFGNIIGRVPWNDTANAPQPPVPDSPTSTDPGGVPPNPANPPPPPAPPPSGFGGPTPGQLQSLTDSMTGFSPLAPQQSTANAAPAPKPAPIPMQHDTITISRKSPHSSASSTPTSAYDTAAPSQQRKPVNWYSGFGSGYGGG